MLLLLLSLFSVVVVVQILGTICMLYMQVLCTCILFICYTRTVCECNGSDMFSFYYKSRLLHFCVARRVVHYIILHEMKVEIDHVGSTTCMWSQDGRGSPATEQSYRESS